MAALILIAPGRIGHGSETPQEAAAETFVA
ncbi:hypothetical protein HRbin41_01589 [bacterium HR41]|nr:hypothetical protein HRbin41_01589 [bacterium HR41]